MSNTQYIEVTEGPYKGERGYIKRIINGTEHPNECVIYKVRDHPANASPMEDYRPHRALLKDSELVKI